ncbi:hypothetical protein RJ640_019404 [Escallonia rubra]|uniref:DUF4218 domain-containing protein n=1 Tax=Escallonia rubra TaxID=112253 RepID=A0AA88QZ89_9ASTE|nr:hypothetical protein RJ640_019404 [Escallonia rubra]
MAQIHLREWQKAQIEMVEVEGGRTVEMMVRVFGLGGSGWLTALGFGEPCSTNINQIQNALPVEASARASGKATSTMGDERLRFSDRNANAKYIFTLQDYVRTRSHPKGSIAEGYRLGECVTFCSSYLNNNVETKLNRPVRLDDDEDSSINSVGGHPLGASEGFVLDDISYAQAHRYVLVNSDAITQYRGENLT